MAVSTYQQLSWGDEHTNYLCQLYTLYTPRISWPDQLCDFGYKGYPDPRFESSQNVYKPDFLAVGEDGDVQHFSVVTTSDLDGAPEEQIEDTIEAATEYRDIENSMVLEFLESYEFSPNLQKQHEIVILLPKEIYSSYKSTVKNAITSNGLILWLISSNGSEKIWKEIGDHSNLDLDSRMDEKIETYPGGGDLLQFSRKTDQALLKFEFIQRLVKYCSRERQRTFHFTEIDEVMTEIRPPMLWHLSKAEREEYWKDFLYSLLNSLELIEQTNNPNEYQWKKKKFQTEPRYRTKILRKVKDEIGLES